MSDNKKEVSSLDEYIKEVWDNYKDGFTHTSTNSGNKIHSITINMCNTGNLTRKGHGGEKHAIFHIRIVYTSSTLKVNLNKKMKSSSDLSSKMQKAVR